MTLVIVLQLLDLATTFYGMHKGAVEVNPFLKRLPHWALVVAKFAFIGFILAVPVPMWTYMVIGVLYILVIANNVRVIVSLRTR